MSVTVQDPWTNLPLSGPHDVGVGHALITLVEPHVGHERAYNRWYEDDHMFSGALYLPWLFSGRRWVATNDLQQLRLPKTGSPIVTPITKGCYLSTYWITPGRIDVHKEWSFSVYQRLSAEARVNDDRDHVYTSFQDKVGTIYHDGDIPRDVFTLMDPAPGLILEILDAPSDNDRRSLEQWLLEKHLPEAVANRPVSSVMVFRTRGPDPNMKPEVLERVGKIATVSNDLRRLTILWFLTEEPSQVWGNSFASEPDIVHSGGLGEVSFLSAFLPAKMGTNRYDDMLRAPS